MSCWGGASAPLRGESALRLDCFTLRVRNDDAPSLRPTPPVIASEARQSRVTASSVWIASPFGFAMTGPPHLVIDT
ncbi:MAG: hypothetical protein LBT00_13570 [Spirochaetaceae bacterium]|nr:hypothetical protein [Spirochaetaceae bacterium]